LNNTKIRPFKTYRKEIRKNVNAISLPRCNDVDAYLYAYGYTRITVIYGDSDRFYEEVTKPHRNKAYAKNGWREYDAKLLKNFILKYIEGRDCFSLFNDIVYTSHINAYYEKCIAFYGKINKEEE